MDNSANFNGLEFNLPKNKSNVIKVIGVGGGGGNAVNYMYSKGIEGVDFVICNTDAQALSNSPIPTRIQLGANLTEGLGAGADPEIGKESAIESISKIESMLGEKTKMVFITVGMGGGTGTGAAPIIAKAAKEKGLLTVAIVTIPFGFEGKKRNEQAQVGIEKLSEQVDSIIVINNNKLREVYGNLGFTAGYSKADEVLSTAALGIAKVITMHYMQNIDFRDAKTVLENSGSAIMGSAKAKGENRAQEAITMALDSPLLNDNKIVGAKNVLLLLVSGESEITFDEIGEINDFIRSEAKGDVNIIMGVGKEEGLGDAVEITIIATGFNKEQQNEITKVEHKKVVFNLSEQAKTTFSFDQPKKEVQQVSIEPKATKEETPKILHQLEDEKATDIVENKSLSLFDIDVKDATFIQKKKMIVDEPSVGSGFFGDNLAAMLSETKNELIKEEDKKEAEEEVKEELVAFKLIPTTQVIENIDVIYDEVIANEFIDLDDDEAFIITNTINDIEVIDMEIVQPAITEEKEQMSFAFELPLEVPTESISNEDEISIKAGLEEAKQMDVIDTNIVSENKIYNLDDYLEIEKKFNEAKPKEFNEVVEPSLQMETKLIPENEVVNAEEVLSEDVVIDDKKEVSPLYSTINELASRADERRIKMKNSNYRFVNQSKKNIDELEKEPAYKRNNVSLDENPSGETNISRTSLNSDGNTPNLRSNNSFLHDNVD